VTTGLDCYTIRFTTTLCHKTSTPFLWNISHSTNNSARYKRALVFM
jgi:hypothetical protein